MTSKVNQRVKRKNNFLDTKIEPNMKALKKDDIIAKFNALQENFDILKKKNGHKAAGPVTRPHTTGLTFN